MQISLVGVNHRTAPITVREKVAIRSVELHRYLSLLRDHATHGIILSTCNRTEVYIANRDDHDTGETGLSFFQTHLNIPSTDLTRYAYVITKQKAVAEHLFRTACGLDSLIIGEYEILGQVGNALDIAEKAGMVNLPLRHLFQSAIRTGRRVREETSISKNALSVSSVVVDLATRVIGDLSNCRLLIIGAGEAGRLVAKAVRGRGTPQIIVASRTPDRASALAATLDGSPVDLKNLVRELITCNIVVTCAESPDWILTVHHVTSAMRQRPELPLVVIDIAVPRNVEPAVEQINNVFLYNIDDLTEISEANRKQREEEITGATEIICGEMDKLAAWWQALETRPAVSTLMEKAETIRSAQLDKTLKKLRPLSQEERDYLEAMTKSIVTKILEDPLHYLKNNTDSSDDNDKLIRQLFQFKVEKPE
ncbi:MAG: glutamyl-tRNA reductase [Dehalococcoidales bacterium]|nr:glutamyl-tRNA reductase [Dehalococcoidales bacterium]